MGELLGGLGDLIRTIIETLGYPGIILVMAAENIFPPIPSELVMPLAGFMAYEGTFNIVGVIFAGMIGSVVGALALYWLGAWANETVIRRFVRRWGRYAFISEKDIDVTLGYFSRHGEAVIFFGRLISIPAGMERMPLPKFLLFTVLGTTIWSAILSYAGWALRSQWESVLGYVKQYERLVLVVVVLAVLVFLYMRVLKPRLSGSASLERK